MFINACGKSNVLASSGNNDNSVRNEIGVFQRIKRLFSKAVHSLPTPSSSVNATSLTNTSQNVQQTAVKVVNLVPQLAPMQIDLNTQTIIQGIREAVQGHSGEEHLLIHTPEMSITAYDCGDLHQISNSKTQNGRIEEALKKIMAETRGISVTVGFPYYNEEGKRVIMHALISDGEIVRVKGKEELANNIGRNRGVEYETRFFVPCENGMKFKLLGSQHTYGESLFSNNPVEIAGKRVSLVICEEMFTGTDQIDSLYEDLGHRINAYLERVLKRAIPDHAIEINEAFGLMKAIESAEEKLVLPEDLFGFTKEEIGKLNEEFQKDFASFKKGYLKLKTQYDEEIRKDIEKENRLYKQLEESDIVLIPNGSPSASGKQQLREGLFHHIASAYQKKMGDGEKVIYYSNNNGIQAGSVAYDGTVLKTKITKEEVSISLLSSHAYGLVNDEKETPVWATKEGREEVINTINGTKIYSGLKATSAAFGHMVSDVYSKFYHDTDYAYSTLMKLLKEVPPLEQGEIIPKGNKIYSGFFVSQSGGFDSAHTAIVLAKSFERRIRTLYKEKGQNLDTTLKGMKKELLLDHRAFDIDTFCARFLTARVNVSDDLEKEVFHYKNLKLMAKILGIEGEITEENHYEVIELVRAKLEGVKTVSDLLDLAKGNLPINGQLEFLSKLVIFHLVKAAYLRTDNNSIDTEHAARSLDVELGIDFEVRNVDADFKTALLLEKGIDLSGFEEFDRIKILQKYSEILAIGKRSKIQDRIDQLKAQNPEAESEIEELEQEINEKAATIKVMKQELAELVNKESVDVHNWFESSTGLEIENIQARLRAQLNWQIANEYGYIPTSNPNADEAKQGYTTVSGDLHAGLFSETGQHRKTGIYAEMIYLMKKNLKDAVQFFGQINPIKAIYNTFRQPPSAELQQLNDKAKGKIQQTDEDSYGMPYPMLSIVGDSLFKLTQNGCCFEQMSSIYANHFKENPIFHGSSKWEIFSKMDKVNRQWYMASFKRRSAPWQMTNSDSAVDHHSNSRTEFAGFDNAMRFERTALLLTLLVDENIVQGVGIDELLRHLLLDSEMQGKLQSVLWGREKPADLKELINLYKHSPELLKRKITERVEKAGIKLKMTAEDLKLKNPTVDAIEKNEGIVGKPIAIKARDLSGNVEKAKKAIAEAVQQGKELIVIPDLIGTDLGDNLRRVSPEHLNIVLDELKRFSLTLPKKVAFVMGHPALEENTSDRSRRYYQAASVIQAGELKGTFFADAIDNNHDQPGASYDTRTFQPYKRPQEAIVINGKPFYIAIGQSSAPAGEAQIIHLGSMEAEDQFAQAIKHGTRLAGSFNAVGSPSGIRCFNGRSIYNIDQITAFKKEDATPEAPLLQDARWLEDYLPAWGKVTVVLDSPESLYTLGVMKKRIEMKKGVFDQKTFNEMVDVVTPYYSGEEKKVEALWGAASDLLGFELAKSDSKHATNQYRLDSLCYIFRRNAIVGDINMSFFNIKENDSWLEFDKQIKTFFEKGEKATKEQLEQFKALLSSSTVLKASLSETYRREQLIEENNFEPFASQQISLMVNRIRDFDFSSESAERMRSTTAWLLSARDGGEGQIMLSNIARNDLCCSQENFVGARLNQGGLSVTASRSLKEMKSALTSSSETLNGLFDQKMEENIVEGLMRSEVDEIYESLKDHNFDITDMCETGNLAKLELFAKWWRRNNLDRHCIPNAPHTKYSVDQQTSFREPMLARWLEDQILLFKERLKAKRATPPPRRSFFSCFRNREVVLIEAKVEG